MAKKDERETAVAASGAAGKFLLRFPFYKVTKLQSQIYRDDIFAKGCIEYSNISGGGLHDDVVACAQGEPRHSNIKQKFYQIVYIPPGLFNL